MDTTTNQKQDSITINNQQLVDHDVLIRIEENLKNLAQKIDDKNVEILARIVLLEKGAIDHEKRFTDMDLWKAATPFQDIISNSDFVTKFRNNLPLIGIFGTILLAVIIRLLSNFVDRLF